MSANIDVDSGFLFMAAGVPTIGGNSPFGQRRGQHRATSAKKSNPAPCSGTAQGPTSVRVASCKVALSESGKMIAATAPGNGRCSSGKTGTVAAAMLRAARAHAGEREQEQKTHNGAGAGNRRSDAKSSNG